MYKLLLVDDHKLLISGLKSIIETEFDAKVRIETQSTLIMNILNGENFDLIITDLNMPELNGIELIKKIRQTKPLQKIAVITMYYTPQIIAELLEQKVNGFFHKSIDDAELIKGIQMTLDGKNFFPNNLKQMHATNNYDFKVTHNQLIQDDFLRLYSLTKREHEIFKLIIANKTSQEIADKMYLSKDTVSTHRKNIIRKTGCTTIIDFINLAMKHDLLENKIDD